MKISDQISIDLSVSRASVRYLIKTVKIKTMSLERDMRRCLRTNRSEAVSLDSAMVRIEEQEMEWPEDCRFAVHRPTVTSRDGVTVFVANAALNRLAYLYDDMNTKD